MKVVDRMLEWANAGRMDLLKAHYPLPAPEILFRKIEDAEVAAQVQKLKDRSQQNQPKVTEAAPPAASPAKETIAFDDFAKVELRVGKIVSAQKVEKADKLLQLQVDMGSEVRTIVSGIALHFSPEDIVGKQVVVVANLAPRKMRGIESNGMILMAEGEGGKLTFVSPESVVPSGSEVR